MRHKPLAMDRKKIFLYVSAACVWLFIVMCTLMQDHSNSFSWQEFEDPTKQIALEGGASIFYGPLSTGDTEVSLEYGDKQVSTVVPEKVEEVACKAVFPANEKYVGATFEKEGCLDTMVLFSSSEAFVFRHMIAMDSDRDMVACLETNESDSLTLVITTFDKITIKKIELKNLNPTFLVHPQIESALFIESEFKLDTAFGNFKVALPSLI